MITLGNTVHDLCSRAALHPIPRTTEVRPHRCDTPTISPRPTKLHRINLALSSSHASPSLCSTHCRQLLQIYIVSTHADFWPDMHSSLLCGCYARPRPSRAHTLCSAMRRLPHGDPSDKGVTSCTLQCTLNLSAQSPLATQISATAGMALANYTDAPSDVHQTAIPRLTCGPQPPSAPRHSHRCAPSPSSSLQPPAGAAATLAPHPQRYACRSPAAPPPSSEM